MSYTDINTIIAEGKIANALKSTAADHVVAKAENIYDTALKGYQSEINDNFTNKFNNYLLLAGGTLTGDLTLKTNTSGAPSIIFQRGETNDSSEDWKMTDVGGYFKIQNRNSENTWIDVLSLAPSITKTLTSSYNILPSTTNALDLGSSSREWRNVYGNYFSGTSENTNNIGNLKYFKYMIPDNGGRPSYILIAKMSNWVVGTNSNYYLIGTIYGQRGGNQARTHVFNITAQAVSYSGARQSILNVSNHYTNLVVPCIVEYTDENNETCNYLALKKTGSGDNIYFVGLMGSLLPQSEWIELNVESGQELPTNMTIVTDTKYNNTYPITTGAYYDGSAVRTLLHSGNYSQYANKYVLPAATSSALGGIKIGYTQSGKNYPVQLDANNKAYVNVPWTDTDTNTDTKVTQTVTTTNANYPLLLAPAGQTATTTTTSYFKTNVTLNPSTNILAGAKVYESLLQWGNTNIPGGLSPLDTAMDSQWSANRLSFMPASGINIEYSTDGGTTWTDYGSTDAQKRSLVTTGLSYALSPGKNTTRQKINSDRVRVTITAESGKTYFSLKKIYMYISQNGASGCKVLIEKSQCGSDTTFVQVGEYSISGWSGWNSIPLTAAFGGGDGQTSNIRRLRFTYYFTQYSTGYGETDDKSAVKWTINKLNMIGETSWSNTGGSLATTGHIYSYDINKNTTFPANIYPISNNTYDIGSTSKKWANIYATNFNGALKGNADTATTATYIKTGGKLTAETTTNRAAGLRLYEIYSNGYPCTYGNVLQFNGANGVGQLACQWHGTGLWYRSAPDTSTTFSDWTEILTDTNFVAATTSEIQALFS